MPDNPMNPSELDYQNKLKKIVNSYEWLTDKPKVHQEIKDLFIEIAQDRSTWFVNDDVCQDFIKLINKL